MKQYKISIMPALIRIYKSPILMCALLCLTTFQCVEPAARVSHVHLYHKGEILYPDYAHVDTLVVEDAASLNSVFDPINDQLPETDSAISEELHNFCHPLTIKWSDYGLDVDSTGYTIWDGDRLVSHIPFNKSGILDSVILNDND